MSSLFTEFTFHHALLLLSGVFVESLVLTRPRSRNDIMVIIGSALIGILLFASKYSDGAGFAVGGSILVYAMFVAAIFRERIIPIITEHTVLLWTIILWYVMFEYAQYAIIAIASIVPSVYVLLLNVYKNKVTPRLKFFMILWYLLTITAVTVIAALRQPIITHRIWTMFFFGMVLMYIASHLYFLFALIPIRSRGESASALRVRLHDHIRFLRSKYGSAQSNSWVTLITVGVIGGAAVFNHYSGAVSPVTFVSIAGALSGLGFQGIIDRHLYKK